MNAYNEIDGVPCGGVAARSSTICCAASSASTASWWPTTSPSTLLHAATTASPHDKGEAARLALEAGLDVELPQLDCYGEPLREALERGAVDVALVDRGGAAPAAHEVRSSASSSDPYVDAGGRAAVFDTPAQRALARELARKSIVLLQERRRPAAARRRTLGRSP